MCMQLGLPTEVNYVVYLLTALMYNLKDAAGFLRAHYGYGSGSFLLWR